MNEFLQAVGHLGAILANDLAQHIQAVGIGSGALFFVIVNCMPPNPPKTIQDYWTWVRDALQTLTPARYHQNPQQPAEPARK